MTSEVTPDPRTGLRERRFATVVFVALVLLSAGVKWARGWPLGAAIVVALGIFYILLPIHRWPVARLWFAIGPTLAGLGLQIAVGDVNSPVSNLGTTLVALSMAGGLMSPSLVRPARFEAMGGDVGSAVSA